MSFNTKISASSHPSNHFLVLSGASIHWSFPYCLLTQRLFAVLGGPILIYTSGTSRFVLRFLNLVCWDKLFENLLNFATTGVTPSSSIARSKGWYPCSNFCFNPIMSVRRPWSGRWSHSISAPSYSQCLLLSCTLPRMCSTCALGSWILEKVILCGSNKICCIWLWDSSYNRNKAFTRLYNVLGTAIIMSKCGDI